MYDLPPYPYDDGDYFEDEEFGDEFGEFEDDLEDDEL